MVWKRRASPVPSCLWAEGQGALGSAQQQRLLQPEAHRWLCPLGAPWTAPLAATLGVRRKLRAPFPLTTRCNGGGEDPGVCLDLGDGGNGDRQFFWSFCGLLLPKADGSRTTLFHLYRMQRKVAGYSQAFTKSGSLQEN